MENKYLAAYGPVTEKRNTFRECKKTLLDLTRQRILGVTKNSPCGEIYIGDSLDLSPHFLKLMGKDITLWGALDSALKSQEWSSVMVMRAKVLNTKGLGKVMRNLQKVYPNLTFISYQTDYDDAPMMIQRPRQS